MKLLDELEQVCRTKYYSPKPHTGLHIAGAAVPKVPSKPFGRVGACQP